VDLRVSATTPATAARHVLPGRQPAARPRSHQVPAAVILAAGAGTRLRGSDGAAPPKPLTPVLGRPLIERTIRTFRAAGVSEFVVIVGYERELLTPELHTIAGRLGVHVIPVTNHRWELGNGTSVLAAAEYVGDRFFLAMSDHLFTPAFLDRLIGADEGLPLSLVVDHGCDVVSDLAEATKVRLADRRIVDIGKDLTRFDAVDTGVFLCRPVLFSALRRAQQAGDCSLTGAVRVLAAEGRATTVPSDGLFWQDVDTPADLALAERRLEALRLSRATPESLFRDMHRAS
jgi:choline kinase